MKGTSTTTPYTVSPSGRIVVTPFGHALIFSVIAVLAYLITPMPARADFVVSDFELSDSDTIYVCRAQQSSDGGSTVELYERSAPITGLWSPQNFSEEYFRIRSLRKRWKRIYRSRKRSEGRSSSKTKRALRRWRKYRSIAQSLRECGAESSLVISSAICEEVRTGVSTRIINGQACNPNNSSHVLLRLRQGLAVSTCSGTVIGPHSVLTAAHCVEHRPRSVDIVTGNGIVKASSYISHPLYDPFNFIDVERYDVAIIKTSEQNPIPTNISQLVTREIVVGERAIVAGFGVDENGDHGDLRALEVRISAVEVDSLSHDYNNTTNFGNTCYGDSGGALTVSENGKQVIAGITSNGDLVDCGVGDTTRYTNVRFGEVRRFIDQLKG